MISCFFFFKQKTAYEMRISDWSSDVCSSDLLALAAGGRNRPQTRQISAAACRLNLRQDRRWQLPPPAPINPACGSQAKQCSRWFRRGRKNRSEEHTSELQSLMRNSYAVFCLKKKKTNQIKDKSNYSRQHEEKRQAMK